MSTEWMAPFIETWEQALTVRELLATRVAPQLPGAGRRTLHRRSYRIFQTHLRTALAAPPGAADRLDPDEPHPRLDAAIADNIHALATLLEDLHSPDEVDDIAAPLFAALPPPAGEPPPAASSVARKLRRTAPASSDGVPIGIAILAFLAVVVGVYVAVRSAVPVAAGRRSRADVADLFRDAFVAAHPQYSAIAARVRETLLGHGSGRTLGLHIAVTNATASLRIGSALVDTLVEHVHYMHHPHSRGSAAAASGRPGGCRSHGSRLSMCRLVSLSPPSLVGRTVLDQVADALLLHEKTLFVLNATLPGFAAFDVNSLVGSLLDDSLPFIVTDSGIRLDSSKSMLVILSPAASPRPAFAAAVDAAFASGHAPIHRAADHALRSAMRDTMAWDDRLVHRLAASLVVAEDELGWIKVWAPRARRA